MSENITAAKTAKALNNCACGEFQIGFTTEENGEPDFDGTGTGCTNTTRRVFSPGCDAKLKSLLIRAGIEGMEVHYGGGIVSDAVNVARQFGFAPMVAAGIERGLAKLEAKAAKAAAPKAPRKAGKKDKVAAADRAAALTEKMAQVAAKVTVATEDTPVAEPIAEVPAGTVQIKLGRWEYSATIVANGDAHYKDAKGTDRIAVEGNYKLV